MMHNNNLFLRTAEEWEKRLGKDIRELRLRHNVTQSELARRAKVDRTTVVRIESGKGGSVRSLVQLARALGREDWLDSFAPPAPGVSPVQLLQERRRHEASKRVRASSGSDAVNCEATVTSIWRSLILECEKMATDEQRIR